MNNSVLRIIKAVKKVGICAMNLQKAESQHKIMTETGIRPLILRFGAPTMVGLVVIALYSLADAFFVSELGTAAGAAVGVTFAITALLQAVGYTLGLGAGSLMSRSLGSRKGDEASAYAKIAFWLSLFAGSVIMSVGLFWGGPVIRFLGANESIYPLALAYSHYLFLSAPFMCGTFVLSQLLRAEGKALYSMFGLVGGSLLNIILDPLLITTLHMGIAGASCATLISQLVSFLILLSAYLFHHSQIRLFRKFSLRDFAKSGKILVTGLPSSFRQGLIALSTILLNHATAPWSDAAVAAVSVVTRLFLLVFAVCLGVGQGMMPVAGYNYGSEKYDRVLSAYRFSMLLATFLMLVISIPMMIFAPQLIGFFRNDREVIAIGTVALRAQSAVLVLHGLITCTILILQALGKSFSASLLASARQGVFFLPLIFLLPSYFGIESVIFVQPIADGLTFLFAIPFAVHATKHLKQKTAEGSQDPHRGTMSN